MSAKKKPIGSAHRLPPSGTNALQSPYKGHMSVKSNAFSATGCTRLTNQYGVMDQINVHYKKIQAAKSCIDSSTPKSWTTSVKKADQIKRQTMQKRSKLILSQPSSARSTSRASRSRPSYDIDNKDLTLQDLQLVDRLLDDDSNTDRSLHTTRSNPNPQPARQRSKNNGFNDTHRTKSDWGNTTKQGYTTAGLSTPMRSQSRLSGTYNRPHSSASADLLDQRADRFTSPRRDYTPRTLKTNVKSRLTQSKNYNPPKRKGKSMKPSPADDEEVYSSFSEEDIELHPQEQDQHQRHSTENGEPTFPGSPRPGETNEAVLQWVNQHSNQHPQNGSREFNSTLGDIQEGQLLNQPHNSYIHRRYDDGSQLTFGQPMSEQGPMQNGFRYDRRTEMTPRKSSRKLEEQEEELRYLEFVTDVTNDVLNRGIYTNRVLMQVFQTHVQLHKDQLDEARMTELMRQLQKDLQILGEEEEEEEYDDR